MGSIQVSQPCRAISRRQLLLTTNSLEVPGTLLIDLTMKPPSGFEPTNPGLVIGKHLIISLILHSNRVMYTRLKYRLNMINKRYLHPIGTSDYSNNVLNVVLTCSPSFQ